MRTCKFAPVYSVSLLFMVVAPGGNALALGKPPTQDTAAGLGGTVNIAAAASTVIDRSYALNGFANQGISAPPQIVAIAVEFMTDNTTKSTKPIMTDLQLRDYLNLIATSLPGAVGGLAFQQRSYARGPSYSTSEISIGNFPVGLDVSYQHYEGGLQGDGSTDCASTPGTRAYLVHRSKSMSRTFV